MKNFSSFRDKFITESNLGENLLALKPVSAKGTLYKINALKHIKESVLDFKTIVSLVTEANGIEDVAVQEFSNNLRAFIVENNNAVNLGYLFENATDKGGQETLLEGIEEVILEGETKIGVSVMVGGLSRFKDFHGDLRSIEGRVIESNIKNMESVNTDKYSISTPISYVHETEESGSIVRVENLIFNVTESAITLCGSPNPSFISLSESAKQIGYNVEEGYAEVKTALGTIVLDEGEIKRKNEDGAIVECDKTALINEFSTSVSNLQIDESEMKKLDNLVAVSENKESYKALEGFKLIKNHMTNESALIICKKGIIMGSILESQRAFKETKNFGSIVEAVEFVKGKIGVDAIGVFEAEIKDEKYKEDAVKDKIAKVDESISKLTERREKVLEGLNSTTVGGDAHTKYADLDVQIGESLVGLFKKKQAILEGKDVSVDEAFVKPKAEFKKGDRVQLKEERDSKHAPVTIFYKVHDIKQDPQANKQNFFYVFDIKNEKDGHIKKAYASNLVLVDKNVKESEDVNDDDPKGDEDKKVDEAYKEGIVVQYKKTKDGDGETINPTIKYRESSKDFAADFGEHTDYSKKLKDLMDDMDGAGFKVEKMVQESLNEAGEKDGDEYKKFFASMLKKFNVTEPDQLEGDAKKKFFDAVDKGWKSDKEEDGIAEGKILRLNESEASDLKKYNALEKKMAKTDLNDAEIKEYNDLFTKLFRSGGKKEVNEAKKEKITMNNLDWGKTTDERNSNLDKFEKLKTDEERESFKRKLKGDISESEKETPADKIDSDEEAEKKNGEGGTEKEDDKSDVDVEESVFGKEFDFVGESELIGFVLEASKEVEKLDKKVKGALKDEETEIDEASDWGTLEISDENELIKFVVSMAKKVKGLGKKVKGALKSQKIDEQYKILMESLKTD